MGRGDQPHDGGFNSEVQPRGGIWREAAGRLWKIPHTFHRTIRHKFRFRGQVQTSQVASSLLSLCGRTTGTLGLGSSSSPLLRYLSSTGTGRGLVVVVFKVLRDCIYQIGT